MKNSLLYLNIAPTKTDDKKSGKQKIKQETMPSFLDLEVKQAETEAKTKSYHLLLLVTVYPLNANGQMRALNSLKARKSS